MTNNNNQRAYTCLPFYKRDESLGEHHTQRCAKEQSGSAGIDLTSDVGMSMKNESQSIVSPMKSCCCPSGSARPVAEQPDRIPRTS